MNGRINILNELKELQAVNLVNTGNKIYYAVPDNYFDSLPDNIRARVFLNTLPVNNLYFVPAGYFEAFAETVLEIIKEKKLDGLDSFKVPVYSVPDGYFDNFANSVLHRIKSPLSSAVQQELEEVSPLLNSIPKTNVYTVPENYFEKLQLVAVEEGIRPAAKVISINSNTRKWLNYAAAACIAAVLFGGGYLYFSKPTNVAVSKTNNSTLAAVDLQKEITGLSDDEINAYLKSNNNTAVYTNAAEDDNSENLDLQSLLQNVSDEEIQQYLNQYSESGEKGGGI